MSRLSSVLSRQVSPTTAATWWCSLSLLLAAGAAACGSDGGVTGPARGVLVVSAPTTGSDLDLDGYSMTLDAGASRPLATNGADTVEVSPGGHSVTLAGLADNCGLGGTNTRSAEVAAGDTARIEFQITCTPLSATPGSIRVTVATTGEDLDPDGYGVTVDDATQHIAVNGTLLVEDVPVGSHPVTLSGLAPNCAVSGDNPLEVAVGSGGTTPAAFAVVCSAVP
jgi:hypothetical protein